MSLRWRTVRGTVLYAAGFICLLSASLLLLRKPVSAADTTYYINNQAGSNCSNAGAGTSPSAPWCDFTNVNGMTFGGGDKILLARGATWNQQMTINGSGTSGNWAEIGAYGSGDRPKIIRNMVAGDRGIRMNNPSYWKVSDLEIGYAGAGILVWYDTKMHEGLHFSNIYVHHNVGYVLDTTNPDKIFFSAGIVFTGSFASMAPTEYAVRNVVMDRIEGAHNQDSISFDWQNGNSAGLGGVEQVVQNVVLKNLNLHDDDGAGVSPGCSDSLRLVNMSNVTVMNSKLNNEASCHAPGGTAAVFFGRLKNVNFVNSMVTNTPYTNSHDMTAFDYEFRNEQVNVRNSYIAGNAGPGLEFLDINCGLACGDFSINHTVSSNVFAYNGHYLGGGSIEQNGSGSLNNNPPTRPSGTIRDNLYHEPNGAFLVTGGGGSFSSFAVTNNRSVSSRGDLYYAAVDFASTQGANHWTYQYKPNGGAWTNLPSYDSANANWYHSAADRTAQAVYQFEQNPGACASCDVARAWTAPANGYVSIRGLALKSDTSGGNGVVARITQNGNRIWPAGGDQTIAYNDIAGVESNLDMVVVSAGDVIRFEVGNNGDGANDMTSWVPAIAYTSVLASTNWDFNTMGNADGWTATSQSAFTVWGGINTIATTGSDPYMESVDNLNLDAAKHRYIRVRMKNNTPSAIAQIYFQRTDDPAYTEAKSVSFAVTANDSQYTEYVVDMASNPGWTGTIKRLRFDPAAAAGSVNLDYIRVIVDNRWEFDINGNTEGWTSLSQASQSVSGGTNTITSGGSDPQIESADNQLIYAWDWRYIRIRMKNNTSSTTGQIYFQRTGDSTYSEARSVTFPVVANDTTYREYVVFVQGNPNWTGVVKRLRFDPVAAPGTVEVDYIRVTRQ